jgi:hypothetical protein
MSFKIIKITAVFLSLLLYTAIQAQEAVPASGGNATGSGGSGSYTVGQVACTSNAGNSGTVSQGVQQPFEITVVTSLEETSGIALEYSVFPNPASEELRLYIVNRKTENLSYELYDVKGNLLLKNEITDNETVIQLADLAPAPYFLKISDTQKELKIFKIIKTN